MTKDGLRNQKSVDEKDGMAMTQGWIKLHREILEHGIFADGELLRVWMYCLLRAGHKARKVPVGRQMVQLEAGQLLYGRKAVSERLGLSEKKLRNRMEQLVQCESIQIESNTKYSVVTIVNWSAYQEEPCKEDSHWGPTEESVADRMAEGLEALPTEKKASQGPTEGRPRASQGPTGGQQRATNKNVKNDKNVKHEENDKNEKNDKNNKHTEPALQREAIVQEETTVCEEIISAIDGDKPKSNHAVFDRLWKQYPVKKRRDKLTEGQIAQVEAEGEARMQAAIVRYSKAQAGRELNYWMYGSTFFAGGYRDYLPETVEPSLSAPLDDSGWEGLF